ncbi:MAG: phosphatase PAP2 family protein [Rhodospirillales bacterium]|nr:phosphatase PAP2 family protein [Rhodospirillales bacterium]
MTVHNGDAALLAAKPSKTNRLSRFLRLFTLPEYLMLAFVLLYVGGSYWLAASAGFSDRFQLLLYGKSVRLVTFLVAVTVFGGRAYYVMFKIRPRHLTRFLINDVKAFFTVERLWRALPVFVCFTLFLGAFTSMKSMIPVFHAYSWDPFFYELDRILHFGIDPWRILQPVMGYAPVTFVVNVIYNIWFAVMFSVLYWQLFSLRDPQLRLQFFYTYFLSWALNGTLLAVLFSSAGPCFFGDVVTGANPYEPLMAYLNQTNEHIPIWAVTTQAGLWESYQSSTTGIGSGISAMPSMHVSLAFLFFLVGLRTHKWVAIGLGIFFAVILLGSIHLAWHYAVDGYLSIITTWFIWRSSGWLVRKTMPA